MTLTASWNDATHSFTGWGGACAGTTSTCELTMDAAKTVTATFAALPATRCATTTATDCIRAVYLGAPGDYVQVQDIPAGVLLTANSDGRYYVERGRQYTVVTAAQLPTGWTRFYLERTPLGDPRAVSHQQLIAPVGTTYTFTVTEDEAAATLITFDLKQARPFVRPRPDRKPEIGDTVVTAVFQVATCPSGAAVPNPIANAKLVEDCEHLLALEETLAGTGTLNWSAVRPMSQWTGITVAGTPLRVTKLELASSGLTGEITGLLGDLTGLTHLRLNGNTLTGQVPSKLEQLASLPHLYLAGNTLTGCVPPSLRTVANNDIASLGLSDCGTPGDISYGEHTLTAGTYQFMLTDTPLSFDVPAGLSLEIVGLVVSDSAEGETGGTTVGLILRNTADGSWICLDVEVADECNRWLSASNSATIAPLLDRIAESAWMGDSP